jgi:lipid A 4'-phosphatase
MWTPRVAFDPDARHDDEGNEDDALRPHVTAQAMLKYALLAGAGALVLFLLFPRIDLAVARFFYLGHRQFAGNELVFVSAARFSFNVLFYITCAITLLGLVMTLRTSAPWLGLKASRWLFVTLCLIMGPLVVTNIGLKDHWGRARPRDVVEFSGTKAYTAPFPPSRQCDYNCSFVSGEASSIFIVMFAAAFGCRSRSRQFVALAIILGGISGLVRMAQGGHFLSDVIFAGVLMAMTAAILQLLFDVLETERRHPAEQGAA